MTYCDDDQEPTRTRIGTVYRMTWPDGSRARRTLPMRIVEAIMFFDPFQGA